MFKIRHLACRYAYDSKPRTIVSIHAFERPAQDEQWPADINRTHRSANAVTISPATAYFPPMSPRDSLPIGPYRMVTCRPRPMPERATNAQISGRVCSETPTWTTDKIYGSSFRQKMIAHKDGHA